MIFSCCLYGNNSRYYDPLLKNNLSWVESYLGISCEFYIYCSLDVPKYFLDKLVDYGYVVKVVDFESIGLGAMFVRYLPILNGCSDIVAVRDSDCCYNRVELDLIKEWLQSNSDFHIVRGHPSHIYPIMGGLFSVRGSGIDLFNKVFSHEKKWVNLSSYNADQKFLSKYVYPAMKSTSLVHTVMIGYKGENLVFYKNKNNEFVGETQLLDDKRRKEKESCQDGGVLIEVPSFFSKWMHNKLWVRVVLYFLWILKRIN